MSRAELDAFEEELVDRFGAEPPEATVLLRIAKARVLARRAEIAKVDAGPGAIAFTPRLDMGKRALAAGLRASNGRLILEASLALASDRLAHTEKVLTLLARKAVRK
jgi:transcription-repair coupling factor (superfamily II helicase)